MRGTAPDGVPPLDDAPVRARTIAARAGLWSGMLPDSVTYALARLVQASGVLASRLEVTRVDVPIPGLSEGLIGFRIAHVSDLHVGHGSWEPLHAGEAARIVQAEAPDVVVNTGDYLQERPPLDKVIDFARPFVLPSGGGAAPRNLTILGNHDYREPPDVVQSLTRRLKEIGIQVLVNRAACVGADGGVSLVGLTWEAPGFEAAVEALRRATRPRIALVHEPDLVERIPAGSADLILAGHTHGGQITVPFMERLIVRKFSGSRYTDGWQRINDMPVYINRGLGTSGLPVRFRARPQVVLFRLVR